MGQFESLFKFSGDDFEVWSSDEYESTHYHLSIEGYIGYEKLESFIVLYKKFADEFFKYLEDTYQRTERHIWKSVYQTRGIEICYESDCYWIFLEPFKSTQIWDTYYFIQDVIKQLEEFNKTLQ